jgi:hypothetical protein
MLLPPSTTTNLPPGRAQTRSAVFRPAGFRRVPPRSSFERSILRIVLTNSKYHATNARDLQAQGCFLSLPALPAILHALANLPCNPARFVFNHFHTLSFFVSNSSTFLSFPCALFPKNRGVPPPVWYDQSLHFGILPRPVFARTNHWPPLMRRDPRVAKAQSDCLRGRGGGRSGRWGKFRGRG